MSAEAERLAKTARKKERKAARLAEAQRQEELGGGVAEQKEEKKKRRKRSSVRYALIEPRHARSLFRVVCRIERAVQLTSSPCSTLQSDADIQSLLVPSQTPAAPSQTRKETASAAEPAAVPVEEPAAVASSRKKKKHKHKHAEEVRLLSCSPLAAPI